VTNLLNPKMALLFLTLLPQFVADGEPRVATTAILAAVFLLNAVLWWRAFSLAIGPLGRFLSRPRVVAWFDRGTGALLVGIGVRVALERR
jgi:threonine/homoserine/homoserine lactone efflux protein